MRVTGPLQRRSGGRPCQCRLDNGRLVCMPFLLKGCNISFWYAIWTCSTFRVEFVGVWEFALLDPRVNGAWSHT